jgi:glycosyltransferase involved in cell wall biosynthesis
MNPKPQILHLLADRRTGGVRTCIETLMQSRLSEQFDFHQSSLSEYLRDPDRSIADLLIVNDPCNWQLLRQLLRLNRKTKLIIQEHHYSQGFETYNVPQKWRFHLMLKLCYGRADRVVAVSQAQGNWMQRYRLLEAHRLSVISQSTEVEKLLRIAKKPFESRIVIGAYGRFTAQKGFDVLLEAMHHLPQERFRLLLGGYGEEEEKLKQMAQDQDNVEFVGKVENLSAFLERCHAIVIPSRWEPFGCVCLEARAAGKLVIASDVDGLSEQISPAYGLLVPPENSEQLAKAIDALCRRPIVTGSDSARASTQNAQATHLDAWAKLLQEVLA